MPFSTKARAIFHKLMFSRKAITRQAAGGFTLLETVIAMALLGLILLGAFSLLVGSYATMRRTEEYLYVNRLLESAIEMTRNLSFTDIDGDAANGIAGYAAASPVSFNTGSTMLTGANGNILYNKGVPDPNDPTATMTLDNGSGQIVFQKLDNDIYRVTAIVSWRPFRRGNNSQSITTYIVRGGIDKR